jgi:hypothetical protein
MGGDGLIYFDLDAEENPDYIQVDFKAIWEKMRKKEGQQFRTSD